MPDAPHHAEQGEDSAPVKTVLIVEDDADIAEVLTIFLRDATDYQVITVPDGFAALKVVWTLIPHLVLLDYMLPGTDDLECLEKLEQARGWNRRQSFS